MRAAVVSSFDRPPRCEPFPTPVPTGADELMVDVLAAGLHPRVRSQAATALGADALVELSGDPLHVAHAVGEAGKEVDVVIDYLWGTPTSDALLAIIPARVDDTRQLSWIQVGSVAGPLSAIPSAALRAARLQIVGSGQGSVSPQEILAELPQLVRDVSAGIFEIGALTVPLDDVEQAWARASTTRSRLVVVP